MKLPRAVRAVLGALHLDQPDLSALAGLTDSDWREALDYTDRARVTLALRDAIREAAPAWVRERLDRNAAGNAARLAGIEETYRNLSCWLGEAGIEFLALKGLTHCALFGSKPESRVQYDIDLWIPTETAQDAQEVLLARGYESMPGTGYLPTDHLPALIRKTGWVWRGDYFDPEIPLAIELHFQFWNEALERLPAPGVEAFWGRRAARPLAGATIEMLPPPDALAYASLHLLKHLLQGSLNPAHAHELAWILDSLSENQTFWSEWERLHPSPLRRLQAVAFRLAREWFGGRAAAAVQEELDRLPPGTKAWFEEFAISPLVRPFRANKDELWLHLSLLASRRDALHVARRRLLPLNLPSWSETTFVPDSEITWLRRVREWFAWCGYTAKRAYHHAISLALAVSSGVRWWRRARSASKSSSSR